MTPRPLADDDIAVIGVSGRFAGAADPAAFRQAVLAGASLLGPVPEGRFGWALPPRGAMAQARGGFMADIDRFDAALFGISAREAARMDPQARLLLEACRAALEDAGYAPRAVAGRCIGVFVASTFHEWLHRLRQPGRMERLRLTDLVPGMLASRVSRAFDLRGSSEVLNAACSGGLLAVHRACMALRAGECEAALAGGVSLILASDGYVGEARAGMLSPGDESPVFDAAGQGFLRGEGVGVLLLKPLARARAERDDIRAVIRGSAAGHGGAAGGYEAGAAAMQAAAVARALRAAGVEPAGIGYLELQAAGRAEEEAAELAVIAEGFRQGAGAACGLPSPWAGALKPLTGHMEAASGLAQIIKSMAVLREGRVPPIAGLGEPAAAVQAAWPELRLPVAETPWLEQETPRRAFVSGFGFGGSHVHLVLEAAPGEAAAAGQPGTPRAYLLSAATPELLASAAGRLALALRAPDAPAPQDVAFTLLVGRDAMAERLAILAPDLPTLAERLAAFATAPEQQGPWLRGRAGGQGPILGADSEDRAWLSALMAAGHWQKLAALWCGGLEIDWPALADLLPGRRVALPPLPLAETRFWLDDGLGPAVPVPPQAASEQPPDPARTVLLRLLAETLGAADSTAWSDGESPAALGLDSMAAAELRGRIAECCGGQAPSLAALLRAPDLGGLVALMPPLAEGRAAAPPAPDLAGRYDPFPTTDIQFAYLLGRQDVRQHGGFGCQVHWAFDRPRFDLPRLRQAWNRLVERHDMLRAVFAPDATQRVLPPDAAGPVDIPLHDWSGAAPGHAARERAALAARFLEEGFDPARFPLFRLAVTRDGTGDRLHLAFDLLLADGPSLFLLLEEFAALYDAPEQPLVPLGFGFRDYVLDQKRLEGSPAAAADLAYWEARLDSLPGPPALPVLPGSPDRIGFLRLEEVLPLPLWREFERSAAAHGLTANAALMAAFAESLAAWAERPEFCLNVTLANRRPVHPDVFRLVGDFTGNLLLAVPARGQRSFAEHAAALSAQLAADIEHAGCSAVQVLGLLARRRRAPVTMPVVFTALHGYGALLKRPVRIDAIGTFRGGATRTPQVWLDAQVLEAADGLHLSWDALEGIFAPDLLADMFAGFTARVRRLAAQPEAWSAPAMPVALPAAVRAANATAARLPREPIFAGILRQAQAAPQREAVIAGDRRLRFGELVGEATALAARLRAADVAPGDLVGVVMPKGWRQVVAVLAIGLAGAAYVPVELPAPPARIQSLLRRAGVRLALTHEVPAGIGWPCAEAGFDSLLAMRPEPFLPHRPAAGELAYVLFTSGSTGEPKGVAMQHGAVSNTLHDINGRFALGASDRVLGVSSLGFDLSVWDIFGVLGAGGALVLPAPDSVRDPAYLAALAAREGVTLWNSTPSYLKLLLEAPGVTLPPSLRLVMLSGDWIPLPLARRLRAEYPAARLASLGGATEAAIWSIWHPVEQVEEGWRSIPYGRPMANQRFHVLDEALRPCPMGEAGQLHIGGAGLAAGYWQDEARTAASFVRHPETGERLYRTGDYGRYLPDGSIEFLGRRDAQVKIGGHRIELAEVEAALQGVPGMAEAVAFPLTDAGGNQRLVAAYRHGAGLAEGAVRAALAATLPPYMVPALLLPLDRMPLTGNGKVDRKGLTERALARLSGAAPGAAPPAAADPAAKLATMLGTAGVLREEASRAAFLATAAAQRRDLDALPFLELPRPDSEAAPARISTRRFASGPVTRDQVAALLAPLREVATERGPRRRYGSAGSTYAVQIYLMLRPQGCDGLEGGLWYYQPAQHRLVHLGESSVLPGALHVPANRAMAEAAALSVLLVGDRAAIRPLYGEMAEDLLRVEAGCISQLLAEEAAVQRLGLCGVGWMDIEPLRAGLRLSPDHVLLHAMVGGQPATGMMPMPMPVVPVPVPAAIPPRPAGGNSRVGLVRQAWEAVLEHADFGDDANFFEVGGNSFLAVALQARLAAQVRPAPSVTDLFRHPTVRALAAHLAGQDAPPGDSLPVLAPANPTSDPLGARRARRLAARRHVAAFATAPVGQTRP